MHCERCNMPDITTKPTTIPARVRAAREAAGLTQEDLGDRMGVSKARISDVEQGRHHAPRLEWLVRAARSLGIPPSQLHPDLTDRVTPPTAK